MQPLYHPLRVVFGNPERLVVPLFQRPYVWTKRDQWEPLWADVVEVAGRVAAGGKVKGHFLGSVVLEQQLNDPGTLPQRHVIDGQQRLTTLQVLLRAVAHAIAATAERLPAAPEAGGPRRMAGIIAKQLADLTENRNTVDPEETYKVWPTNDDRGAFRLVMDAAGPADVAQVTHRLGACYRFFHAAALSFLEGDDGARVRALATALQDHLRIIVMSLDEGDEPQAIFETLNARGTPLLPVDLVKNWLLWRAQRRGEPVEALYIHHWKMFDADDYWRASIGTGHASRARADAFLVNWLTEQTREAVPVRQVYQAFLAHAAAPAREGQAAGDWMREIQETSVLYRRIEQPGDGTDRFTTFLRRLRVLDVVTLYPFLMHVMARPGSDPADLDAMAVILESFFVRRVVCGLNTRGYGAAFLGWIRQMADAGPDGPCAATLRSLLPVGAGDTLRWPSDAEFKEALMNRALYGTIRPERLTLILSALEEHRRAQSAKTPQVALGAVQIEHVMPRSWKANWPLGGEDPVTATAARDRAVNTLGNLTLVTGPLNAAMSNAAWVGEDLGRCKRGALDAHDVLFLRGSNMRAKTPSFSK